MSAIVVKHVTVEYVHEFSDEDVRLAENLVAVDGKAKRADVKAYLIQWALDLGERQADRGTTVSEALRASFI